MLYRLTVFTLNALIPIVTSIGTCAIYVVALFFVQTVTAIICAIFPKFASVAFLEINIWNIYIKRDAYQFSLLNHLRIINAFLWLTNEKNDSHYLVLWFDLFIWRSSLHEISSTPLFFFIIYYQDWTVLLVSQVCPFHPLLHSPLHRPVTLSHLSGIPQLMLHLSSQL